MPTKNKEICIRREWGRQLKAKRNHKIAHKLWIHRKFHSKTTKQQLKNQFKLQHFFSPSIECEIVVDAIFLLLTGCRFWMCHITFVIVDGGVVPWCDRILVVDCIARWRGV